MKHLCIRAIQLGKSLASDEKRRLTHFSISAILFFCTYGLIYWLNENIPPSLEQELWAIGLVCLCALSFCYAIALQLIYIAARIFK